MRKLAVVAWMLFGTTLPAYASEDAEALVRAGRVAEAYPVAREAALAAPADLAAQELWIDLGLNLGLQSMVLPHYRKRLTAPGDEADDHYLMGRVVSSASEAEAHYRKTLELDPDHARAWAGLAAVLRANGHLDVAEDAYRAALVRDRGLTEAWGGLQATLLQKGDVASARAVARDFTRAVPREPSAWMGLATLEPLTARETLAEGARQVPDSPTLQLALARAHLAAGDGGGAEAAVKSALALAPGSAEGQLLAMAARDVKAGDLDGAGWLILEDAISAFGLSRSSEQILVVRGRLLGLTSDHPGCALCWTGQARATAQLGDLPAALAEAETAARLAPREPEVQATLGLALLRNGRPDDAVTWLGRAVEARPRDASLAVAYLQALQGAGRNPQARQAADTAARRHPYDPRVVLAVAQILSAQGDKVGAYRVLRDSLARTPDPTLVVALAAAARDAGYLAEAAEIMERLARDTGSPKVREVADRLAAEALAARQSGAP